MPRYKLTIEYDGRPFVGWQIQHNGPTVQAALEKAVSQFCGEVVFVQGAGRTDAGVHALGQVAHVDLDKDWEPDTVRDAVNAHLRPRAGRGDLGRAGAGHLRCPLLRHQAALSLSHHQSPRRSDLRARAGRCASPSCSNSGAMHAAAQRLIGTHDFTTFRHSECQAKSPVKTLDRLDVRRLKDDIHVMASARSFLHTQVRSMVGALIAVGEGRWNADDVTRALYARSRSACAPVAPAEGLYLVKVDYEEEARARCRRARRI